MSDAARQTDRPEIARYERPRFKDWPLWNQVRCPHGHHIKEWVFVIDHVVVRCPHRDPRSNVECGALLYVIANDSWHIIINKERVPIVGVAQIHDVHEARQLQRLRNVYLILKYLQMELPPDAQGGGL